MLRLQQDITTGVEFKFWIVKVGKQTGVADGRAARLKPYLVS